MSYNITQFFLTNFKNRGHFEGLKKSLKVLNSSLFPLIYGSIIGYYSLQAGLILGVVCLLISYVLSVTAKHETRAKKIDMIGFISLVFSHKKILYALLGSFLFTFSFSRMLLDLVSSLLVYDIVASEARLGIIISLISLVTMIGMYILGKFINYKHYNRTIGIFLLCYILSLYGFYNSEKLAYISIFSALISTWIMGFSLLSSVISYNSLSSISGGGADYKIEFTLLRECFQIGGWVFGFLILYFSGNIEQSGLIILFSMIIGGAILTSLVFSKVRIDTIK